MRKNSDSLAGCGCWSVLLILNFLLGGWSVNYLLGFFALKVLPFFWAGVVGLFAGELSFPIAVILWILRHFGIV